MEADIFQQFGDLVNGAVGGAAGGGGVGALVVLFLRYLYRDSRERLAALERKVDELPKIIADEAHKTTEELRAIVKDSLDSRMATVDAEIAAVDADVAEFRNEIRDAVDSMVTRIDNFILNARNPS